MLDMLVLTKRMLAADPKTFFSIMVTGKRSIGKTSYSLLGSKDFFVERGETENNSWRMALDCLKFSIDDVIDFLEDARAKDIKKPILIWDDLRVHASGSQYRLDMKRVAKLASLMDFIRTCVSNVILTCPSSSGLLGVFKTYDDHFAKIHYSRKGGYHRLALGYVWSTIPSGKRLVYSQFRDSYSCYMPTWIYREYMEKRKKAFDGLIKEIKSTELKKE
ncbi:MAG: hypothetical protein KGD61_00075 [Candidatus Lokiarchaeota archaeon]|nr:hypothetical protein [Candidatus Lokiarchaeota archaeon]